MLIAAELPRGKKEGKMKKIIDVTDQAEQTDAYGPEFTNVRSSYAEGAERSRTSREMSRHYWIQQERGLVEENIFDPTGKHELWEGAYRRYRGKSPLASLMRELPSGEFETVAEYKEFPTSSEGGIVEGDSEDGTEAAKRYLHKYCVSHAKSALARLSANGSDVLGEAEQLCEEIMTVARLLEVKVLEYA